MANKVVFFWRLLLLFLLVPKTAGAAGALTYGSLRFDESGFDFGDVFRGSELTHRFRFTNVGPGPLTIQGVHAACNCTAAEVDHGRSYQPGESGFVDVKLDTTDFIGSLTKTVTVMSNETLLPDRTLTLRAQVKTELLAEPPLVDFGDVRSVGQASRVVRVRASPGKDLALQGVDYNQNVLTVSFVRDPKKAADWLLTVGLKDTVPTGFLKEQIVVRNSSAHLPKLMIPVRAMIIGNVELTPAYLEFGSLSASEAVRRSVTLHGEHEFTITGTHAELSLNGQPLTSAAGYLKIEPQPRDKDKQDIAVQLTNLAKQVGTVRGKLYIETSDAAQRELAVAFYALFR